MMTGLIKRHPLFAFFSLAMTLSWVVELPLIAMRQDLIASCLPFSLHYLAAFGPLLAAVIITAWTGGLAGLKELWGRSTRWRVGWKWVIFSIFSPVAVFILSMPIVRLVQGKWPDLHLLGEVNYLPYLGVWVLPLWLITYGFGEEVGWRGFALPRLQKTMSVSKATLVLGLLWMLWHFPTFFYHETYQGMGWFILPGFVIGVLCGAVILTWIYNSTSGSILMVALWHGIFDLLTASKAGQDIIPIIMSALIIVAALIITNVNFPGNFHRVGKHVL